MKSTLLPYAVFLSLMGCDLPQKSPEEIQKDLQAEDEYKADSATRDPARLQIKEYLLSDKEPSVKDVMWFTPYTLSVAKFTNGGSEDGFADYICTVLQQHGWDDHKITVNVIDMRKVLKEKTFDIVGSANCDFDLINQPPTFVDFTKK